MINRPGFPDCALWDFAVAVYGRPGAGAACLSLQARRGVDVNLLLFCLWVAESGRGLLGPETLGRAIEAVGPWHGKVVRGLRGARDHLKHDSPQAVGALAQRLRKEILALELDAEHIEELTLAGLAPPLAPEPALPDVKAGHAARNALAYLATLGARGDRQDSAAQQDRADLRALLASTFQGIGAEILDRVLAAAGA